jgi:hypothetical protein
MAVRDSSDGTTPPSAAATSSRVSAGVRPIMHTHPHSKGCLVLLWGSKLT